MWNDYLRIKNSCKMKTLLFFTLFFLESCTHQNLDLCTIREDNLTCDLIELNQEACLPEEPLFLKDILNVALSRNLDLLVKLREASIQRGVADSERMGMLPTLSLNTETSGRDTPFGEVSKSLATGEVSTGSIAREHNTKNFDLSAAWSMLDFGLSYIRSRQEKNRTLTKYLEHQRVKQNLVLDIVTEYWNVLVAQRVVKSSNRILTKAIQRQKKLEKEIEVQLISEMEGLQNQDRLLTIRKQLQKYAREYENSKRKLLALMGLPPGTAFQIADLSEFKDDVALDDIEILEEKGLKTRPELYTQDVQEYIATDEAKMALLQMFPNSSIFTKYQYDGDFFLIHNNWWAAGLRATWNLLTIPKHIIKRETAMKRKELAHDTRLALSVGVLSQIHIAHLRYLDADEQLKLSCKQLTVKKGIYKTGQKLKNAGFSSDVEVFDYEVGSLMAEISALVAYADVQVSLEQINNSIGIPLYFNSLNLCLAEISSLNNNKSSDEICLEDSEAKVNKQEKKCSN
jgi:multidrug efflux system outer membrane protein